MPTHEIIGIVLIAVGVLDAASAMWIVPRIAEERQRLVVKLSLLTSGAVVSMLGVVFLFGIVEA